METPLDVADLERLYAEKSAELWILDEEDHDEDRRHRRWLRASVRKLEERIAQYRAALEREASERQPEPAPEVARDSSDVTESSAVIMPHALTLPCTSEIVVAALDFQQLIHEIASDPADALYRLHPRQFEEFIAGLWHRFGYEVELTKRTRDGGRDIIAVRRAETSLRLLIECKRYSPDRKVDVRLVRQLYGTMVHDGASKAILATTSYFTEPAKAFFQSHWWQLEPRDHDGVIDWVKRAILKSK